MAPLLAIAVSGSHNVVATTGDDRTLFFFLFEPAASGVSASSSGDSPGGRRTAKLIPTRRIELAGRPVAFAWKSGGRKGVSGLEVSAFLARGKATASCRQSLDSMLMMTDGSVREFRPDAAYFKAEEKDDGRNSFIADLPPPVREFNILEGDDGDDGSRIVHAQYLQSRPDVLVAFVERGGECHVYQVNVNEVTAAAAAQGAKEKKKFRLPPHYGSEGGGGEKAGSFARRSNHGSCLLVRCPLPGYTIRSIRTVVIPFSRTNMHRRPIVRREGGKHIGRAVLYKSCSDDFDVI